VIDRRPPVPSTHLARSALVHHPSALYDVDHVPSLREVDAIGERRRPYRTLAAAYLYEWIRRPPVRS